MVESELDPWPTNKKIKGHICGDFHGTKQIDVLVPIGMLDSFLEG